jgi:hypothetical protein
MQRPRFYIIQYMKLTAIAAVVFAVVVNRSPESGALVLEIFLLIGFAPLYLPLLPQSLESVLLKLPEHPTSKLLSSSEWLPGRSCFDQDRNGRCASS